MTRATRKSAQKSSKTRPARTPKDIDEYLAGVAEPARGTLSKVRAAIRSAAPHASETISYRIPAFKQGKVLVWFAGFSDHCSLFPTAEVIVQFSEELKTYRRTKGGIHFPLDKPIRAALLKKIVRARLARIGEKSPR